MKECKECGCPIVRRTFCSKACAGKFRSDHTCTIEKDVLYKEYVTDRRELAEISERLNVSITTIFKYLRKYGISQRGSYIDLSGRKIGRTLVIEPLSLNPGCGKHVRWKCRCDCGCEFECYSSHLTRSVSVQCRDCADKARRSKLELKPYIWHNIKRSAMNRGIKFEFEQEAAYKLFLKQDRKCALSGVSIGFAPCIAEHITGGTTASLDRIDSSKGYEQGNVQWVHKTLNMMKNRHSEAEFIDWCSKVHKMANKRKKNQLAR